MITEDGYDLVSGWKQKRYDPISKTLPTKLFNATARKVSGIKNLHDFNCGLKAYRKEVIKHIEVYGEMHRYIPYLAKNAGFKKIGEKVVHHQARKYGTTKFGLKIFVTATPEIRARRRYDELKAKGQEASFDEILENVKQRDYIDQHRDVSPLRKADDALLLDNTNLTIAQQKEWLFDQFNKVTN